MVNVGTAITKAMTKLTGGLPRPQFVTWFNEIVRDILAQPRAWKFLQSPVTIAIVNGSITIPATILQIDQIVVGDSYFTPDNLITDEQAHYIDAAFAAGDPTDFTIQLDNPLSGYTQTAAGVITFHPTLTGSAIVTGEVDVTADYADNAATIFPLEFENLFIAGLRMNYYDQMKDGRFTKENMMYQLAMNQMKAWDNKRKPKPPFSRHGYLR